MNLRVQTRNEARSPEKNTFLDSSHDQDDECFTDDEVHIGLGRAMCCYLQIEVVTTHSVV